MKQILRQEDLIGKTISKIITSCSDLWIKFTDDSFVIFDVESNSEGFGYSSDNVGISDYEINNTWSELVELGLITKKEHKHALEEEEINNQIRKEQEHKEHDEQKILEEKKLLEELKKKYENMTFKL